MSMSKVSIVIRTCGRPNVLKHALESIREQSYKNIEVILVEDGINISESSISENYQDLNIQYYHTKEKVGRSKAGNIGLSKCNGNYINFLDDDDMFYPNHINQLLTAIKENNTKAAYSIAEESQIVKSNKDTNIEKRKIIRYQQPFNKTLLFYMNYIPIQSILFSKELYEEAGGFDESLDALEDWDLWVRYSILTDFFYLPEITSKYYVPYKSKIKKKRDASLYLANTQINEKFKSYNANFNIYDLNMDLEYIINTFGKRGLFHYAKKVRDYLIYGDI